MIVIADGANVLENKVTCSFWWKMRFGRFDGQSVTNKLAAILKTSEDGAHMFLNKKL